jgi:hypothetical protein
MPQGLSGFLLFLPHSPYFTHHDENMMKDIDLLQKSIQQQYFDIVLA